MAKTAAGLVEFVKEYIGMPYWYGTYVIPCTQSLLTEKMKQYAAHYTQMRMQRYLNDIKSGKTCSDCVGLIKGYGWRDDNDKVKIGANDMKDLSANGMFAEAKEKGTISSIRKDIPGLAVRFDGHIGVYIGNDEVVEARGFDYGIVKTKLSARPWTHWLKIPSIDYGDKNGGDPEVPGLPKKGAYPLGFGKRILKSGTKGEDVKYLQLVLEFLGYNCGRYGADGDFGDYTFTAVTRYQRAKKLTIDGEVGVKTRGVLETDYFIKVENQNSGCALLPAQYPLGFGQRTLKKDMEGEDVRRLQLVLIFLGCGCGQCGADGEFGDDTFLAVVSYQGIKGLTQDGEVGDLTRTEMEKDYFGSRDNPIIPSVPPSEIYPLGFGERILKKSMTGSDVTCLQLALIKLEFGCGPYGADGDFGNATRAAVVSYQKSKELEQDGEVGDETRAELEKDLPDRHFTDSIDEGPPQLGVRCIVDVSQHNKLTDSSINWEEIAKNVGLMILRCGVTRTYTPPLGIGIDADFEFAAAKCLQHKIPFGVYYYGKVGTEAEARAEAVKCWDTANPYNPLFYVYDVEEKCLTDAVIKAWAEQMRMRGAEKLGIYIGGNFYTKHRATLTDFNFIWYPRYGKNTGAYDPKYAPPEHCDLHQYTSAGRVAGFNDVNLDLSTISGDISLEWFLGCEND